MIPVETLRELFDYNYWARDRQLEACAALTAEQFLRPMGSSFSSVRDTLAHLVAVERVWLERWLGRSPTKAEAQVMAQAFAAETFPGLTVVRERWQSVERDLREYLHGLEEAQLKQPLTYTNARGERWTYPLGETLFHVVNHQTYHRGQITTLLRQLGAAAPGIDYLVKYEAENEQALEARG
jgi:uncharacterized damage-inducible protein DinB